VAARYPLTPTARTVRLAVVHAERRAEALVGVVSDAMYELDALQAAYRDLGGALSLTACNDGLDPPNDVDDIDTANKLAEFGDDEDVQDGVRSVSTIVKRLYDDKDEEGGAGDDEEPASDRSAHTTLPSPSSDTLASPNEDDGDGAELGEEEEEDDDDDDDDDDGCDHQDFGDDDFDDFDDYDDDELAGAASIRGLLMKIKDVRQSVARSNGLRPPRTRTHTQNNTQNEDR
jgi:hypothetical protein